MINRNKLRNATDSANTGAAVADAPTPEVPFENGKRSLTVTRDMKPRGKSGDKEAEATKVTFSYLEVNSLDAALPAILESVGNDTVKALELVNSALERQATSAAYDATFGDEIKIRAMIKTMVAAGVDAEVAEATARNLFATKGKSE